MALHKLRSGSDESTAVASQLSGALSKREVEVLQLILEEATTGEIANELFLSKRKVETHRQNILKKTQTKNTAALIKLAMSEGVIS